MNKYSVLMSVYKNDDPNFLEEALFSIYDSQSEKPDEIVVVFDGPLTDELYRVLETFKKGKEEIVKYYPQESNKGLGEALRIGVGKCTGNYIFRMDSDDISHRDRFKIQKEYIESNPQIDVLGTDISEFNYSLNEKMRIRSCPQNHNDIVTMGKRRNPMNHVSVCMKKESLIRAGNYESLLLLEDYYLWLKIIVSGGKLANLPKSLVYVRVGNGFVKKRGSKTRIKGWKILQSYMLKNHLINYFQAITNMFLIVAFTYTPSTVKDYLYNKKLRNN